jgi:hypothetical protein
MGDPHCTLHRCARCAHLWSRALCQDLVLCRSRSTFPRMTTGTVSGTLNSVQEVETALSWVRKGRNHEAVAKQPATGGAGRGNTLYFLRRHPRGRSQFEPDMVIGISAAGGYEPSGKPVSGLPPAWHGASHRRLCQRPRIGVLRALGTPCGPASDRGAGQHRGGQDQAENLTCPLLWAWADGHRNDL